MTETVADLLQSHYEVSRDSVRIIPHGVPVVPFHRDRARDWFFGHSSLSLSLVDSENGSCCDGLSPSGLNHNQGAESTLAHLWTELLREQLESSQENASSESSQLVRSSVDQVWANKELT